MTDFRLISNNELKNITTSGNGFSKIEHAESVAKARNGQEVVVEKNGAFYLYDTMGKDLNDISNLKKSNLNIISFIDSNNNVKTIASSDGVKGVGEKISNTELKKYASNGNGFRKFTDAESVAKNLNHDTAIVFKNNIYYLYDISSENSNKFLKGDNSFIDGKVTGIVKNGNTLANWSFDSQAKQKNEKIAYIENGKIMLKEKEFKISGINVYDLADVAKRSQSELESTLKTIASSGANTVRFWAFTRNEPQDFIKIFDTSKKLGLDLKFIPVLGDHWEHIEAYRKDDKWYSGNYKNQDMINKPSTSNQQKTETYMQHIKETIPAFMNRDEILMIELMNEPEANHKALKTFADDVSTTIREMYTNSEKETGKTIPKHLISLGTLGGETRNGMVGHDYKDLFTLPNIDVATAHDYTFNDKKSTEYSVSPLFKDYMRYAKELNKPFFLGEIGVKVRNDGVENSNNKVIRTNEEAMKIMKNRIKAYENVGFAGGLVWGPQPEGKGMDGSGHGFTYKTGDKVEESIKSVFQEFKD
ncbi:MAG: cellulase family glycosylhydrolase [Candidatus Sericytochromatia bacterium]